MKSSKHKNIGSSTCALMVYDTYDSKIMFTFSKKSLLVQDADSI